MALWKRAGFGGDAALPRWQRVLGWGLSIAVHLTVAILLFWPHPVPSRPPLREMSIPISLMDAPTPPGPPDALKDVAGARLTALRPPVAPLAPSQIVVIAAKLAQEPPAPDTSDILSEAQLAGAVTAGGGAGGSGCDMAQLVQQALRRDPLVFRAVEDAHRTGQAILLWNGDWVRSGEQDGKGLSAVREAILWEVGFAPQACRSVPMHGLVLLSLADGRTRFAIGTGSWRWSDMLGLRRAAQ